MNRTAVLISALLLGVSGTAACGQDDTSPPHQPAAETGMPLNADLSGSGPGTLSSATSLPTIDLRLSRITSVAARMTYASTSGVDGSATKVSGTVFVPKGPVPDGGWPVIAYAHATTGVQRDCAPSLSATLLAASEIVIALVKTGYAVTMTDYQGLGLDGSYHPYLDSTTEGYNVIDSVRAAHKVSSDLSDRWVSFGGSQGGQASWAANELAGTYGDKEFRLLGSVVAAAPADITGFADAAANGDLKGEQKESLQLILDSFSKQYPGFDLDDYRRGVFKDNWDLLLQCSGDISPNRNQILSEITADDVRPSSPEAVDVLRQHLAKASLPKTPATAPMSVIYGGQDELVPPAWTERALERACRMGDVIQIQLQPDKGHADVDVSGAVVWIKGRFNGDPAPDDCGSLLAPQPPPGEGRT